LLEWKLTEPVRPKAAVKPGVVKKCVIIKRYLVMMLQIAMPTFAIPLYPVEPQSFTPPASQILQARCWKYQISKDQQLMRRYRLTI
jgi:hypothetical protein